VCETDKNNQLTPADANYELTKEQRRLIKAIVKEEGQGHDQVKRSIMKELSLKEDDIIHKDVWHKAYMVWNNRQSTIKLKLEREK